MSFFPIAPSSPGPSRYRRAPSGIHDVCVTSNFRSPPRPIDGPPQTERRKTTHVYLLQRDAIDNPFGLRLREVAGDDRGLADR